MEDHPRVCGKDVEYELEKLLKQGSPPRVRERQKLLTCRFLLARITPACAGKTLPLIFRSKSL